MAEQDSQGFFARVAQSLLMLLGRQQQEQSQLTQQADRLQIDGFTRGNDDPDTRRQPDRLTSQGDPTTSAQADLQRRLAHLGGTDASALTRVTTQQSQQTSQVLLSAEELQAIRERLQAHHRAVQAQQQRGRGQGY